MKNGAPTNTQRLFLAVDPNQDTIDRFNRAITELRVIAPAARWVRAEKLHVTLVFLGAVEATMVATIREIMQSVASNYDPFRLQFGSGGTFGDKNHPRVLWAGIGGELDALCALQKVLAEKLAPLGFKPEYRDYSPHLTLARSADPRGDAVLQACLSKLEGATFGETLIREIVLYESAPSPHGTAYSALVRVSLRG